MANLSEVQAIYPDHKSSYIPPSPGETTFAERRIYSNDTNFDAPANVGLQEITAVFETDGSMSLMTGYSYAGLDRETLTYRLIEDGTVVSAPFEDLLLSEDESTMRSLNEDNITSSVIVLYRIQ